MTPQELPSPYAGPPLRIAYVGNYRHSFCTEVHVAASLESLGHTVHLMQEDIMQWGKLPAQCEALGAQAVFWTRTWPQEMAVVEPVLKELAAEGIPTVSYHLDRWHGLNREHQVRDQPFFHTSLLISPNDDPRWADDGVNHFWLPPGVYGPECEPVPPNPRRWPIDVVFVGSHPYPHPEWAKYRGDLLATFQKAFRGRFGILPRRGVPVRGKDLQELYATVPVVLGDSCLAGETYGYWSDRVPETLGRGGYLIHPVIGEWYGDTVDYAGYGLGHFDDAVALARDALEDPEYARKVADHGRATVLARDTYAHRMATVLAVAEGIYGGYREALPVSQPSRTVRQPEAALLAVAPPATSQRRVQLGRMRDRFELRADVPSSMSARFDLRADVPTDGEVLDEVWVRNDYRVSQRFSGTVVDIGANIGAFSVLAALNGAKRVVAFEPEAGNYERLQHNVQVNHVREVVEPERMAVGAGSVVMVGIGGGSRSARLIGEHPTGDDVVPGIELEEILRMLGPVEFLKIDAEGAEYPILQDCPVEALAGVERMAIEFHGPRMPHLSHLDADDLHLRQWGAMVAKLADAGRVEIFGHPMRGGLIHWQRF